MKKKNGFTLIEVILSIAILGMIAISVLTVFGSSLKNISRAGKRTEEVFTLEGNINDEIFNGNSENVIIKKDDITIEVNIPIPDIGTKEVKGKIITVPSSDENIEITTFVPNKSQE